MPNYAYLSETQYLICFVAGCISVLLSLMGSSAILYIVVFQTNGEWRTKIYHRIISGLSIMDLIITTSVIFFPFSVPTETNLPLAAGNFTTCAWNGFFFQFHLGSIMYNAVLSLYYLLMIKYAQPEEVIQRYFEPAIHIIAFGIPCIFGILAIFLDILNPGLLTGNCQFAVYPAGCDSNDDLECERGENYRIPSLVHIGLDFFFAFAGIFCTVQVFFSVRNQTRRNARYTMSGELTEQQSERIRNVGRQAVLYTLAFVNSLWVIIFPAVLNEVYLPQKDLDEDIDGDPLLFAAVLLVWIFYPLQGFFNFFIYIRPRVLSVKKAHAHQSWIRCFWQALSGKESSSLAPPGNNSQNSRRSRNGSSTLSFTFPSFRQRFMMSSKTASNKQNKNDGGDDDNDDENLLRDEDQQKNDGAMDNKS